jgi:hypothetical protein
MKTNSILSRFVLATLLCGLWLAGCSRQDAAAAQTSATAASSTDDPCTLVIDGEVSKALKDDASSKRDHSLDKYNIATCVWDTSENRLMVQLFKAKGSVEGELRSRMSGNLDPMKPGAGDNVRYQKVAGAGEDTMLAVEKADEQKGILADTAVLVSLHGDRMAVLFTSALVGGERAATIEALEKLGRSAAPRL